jgi:hypothetical protein
LLLAILILSLLSLWPPVLLFPAVASHNNDKDNSDENFEEDFEEEDSIQLCCTWGMELDDGVLTYNIDDDSSSEEQDAVRSAIEEWDSKIDTLELEPVSSIKNSNIKIEFQDNSERVIEGEEIAGQTITTFDQDGLLENSKISISRSVQAYAFDPSTIEQIAKHEIGHALGLGHANFDGNLMAERVDDGTDNISECEIKAVIETNYWKLGNDNNVVSDTSPSFSIDDITTCDGQDES